MIENGKNPEQEERGNNHTSSRSLSKGDILEIKNEIVGALEKSKKRPGILDLFKGIGFTLVFTAGLLGYYIQWNADIKQRESEVLSRKSEQLQKTIDRKIEWQVKLNTAMGNLKSQVEMIKINCQEGVPLKIHEQRIQRYEQRFKVLYAMMGIQFIFNDKVLDVAREYLNFDEKIYDVCSKNSPSEIAWREILIKANTLMGEAIRKDQENLNLLNTTSKKK